MPIWALALLHNPMFVGFGGTALIGGLLVWLRNIPAKIITGFLHFFTIQVMLENSDDAFDYVNRFLASHPSTKRQRNLRLQVMYHDDYDSDSHGSEWIFGPGLGSSWFIHKGRIVVIERSMSEGKTQGKTKETIMVRMTGRSQEALRSFLLEAKGAIKEDTRTRLYMYDSGHWDMVVKRTPRLLETIILAPGQQERILADLEWFSGAIKWYQARGIPYHRGYLLSGPAGTGKTSLITAIAGHLSKDVCILNLGMIKSDGDLFNAINNIPSDAVIAIEDVDAATHAGDSREGTDKKDTPGITLASLLNVLDGATTPDGAIFFMTTNYPERLDAALIRPGRADIHETLGLMGAREQLLISERFYGEGIGVEKLISPAKMQGILIQNPNDREAALKVLSEV